MREVGVDSPFAATDVGYSFSHLNIHSDCEKRLLDIELDLGSSACTFEAVQWAISELQRMEQQERNIGPGDDENEDGGDGTALDRSSSKEQKGRNAVDTINEALPNRFQPIVTDPGNQDAPQTAANWTGIKSERQTLHDKVAYLSGPKSQIEGPQIAEVGHCWRQMPKSDSGGKRKPDEEACGKDGEKRAKVGELFSWSKLREVVVEADKGDAGQRMAERINSRLAIPDCIFLTNLVSHCLLLSMDQVPTKSIQEAVASLCLHGTVTADSVAENSSGSGEWMWLHKWLVRTVLSDAGDDGPFASLDWLVAFLTATRQSIIKPILDDLASDLWKRETEGSPTLASYVRRTGVLEYAALRDPERTFGSLRPLLPPELFPTPQTKGDDTRQQGGGNKLWQGWLGLMVLCPRLFGAFARFWVPTLSVETVKSWRIDSATSLPAVWTILVETYIEEPGTKREWVCAAILRRLPQLAPVASHFVVLLSGLDDNLTDHGTNEGVFEFGNYILDSVYTELSKHVLPQILGSDQDLSREVLPDVEYFGEKSGIIVFMETLKQHSHVLWRKALENYSTSKCPCCKVPLSGEVQLEKSPGRTEVCNEGGACVERSEKGSNVSSNQEHGLEAQRGCMFRDPLIQLCHLTLLCCPEHVVADLLASASLIRPCSSGFFEVESLRKLLMVMRVMRIVSGQGRGILILELWAQHITDGITIASDEQALMRVLATRQLLDPNFWQNHHILLGSSSQFLSEFPATATEDTGGHQGLSWQLVWKVLRTALDARWLHILLLMHRDEAWELRLAVLSVLQLLTPDCTTRHQAVADRLKGVLGLFFSWLELSEGWVDQKLSGRSGTATPTLEPRWRWQFARAMEHLKSIIVELAASSFPSFTLMVSSLLDFSFEHSMQMSTIPSTYSSTNRLSRTSELSADPLRRVGSASRSSFCAAPLSAGKLNRYGKLVLISGPGSQLSISTGTVQKADVQLTEENCRIQSGPIISLHSYDERVSGYSPNRQSMGQNAPSSISMPDVFRKDLMRRNKVIEAELGNLLRSTLARAISQSVDLLDVWPFHPVTVLATHMADRLETPHEVPMTMEQYEEVLPKHISSLRHIFLTDCFNQNPLLMEMVELVVKHGDNPEVLRCVEFLRVLLADSISRWHSAFRTQGQYPLSQVEEEESCDRMQVNRLIQLVGSANWLPQPLAASGEIVAVINGADIADLLLLVWRCMHHCIAYGSKGWGGSSFNLHSTGASVDGQAMSTGSGADEEVGKESTYTEWEGHFFAILRRNVSLIGAHFAQVYPIRKEF